LKNFSKDFDQNKETTAIFCSFKHKFGEYNWALGAQVKKNPIRNEFFLYPYFHCDSADQSKFPVCTYLKTSVLNQEKDLRKTHSKGKTFKPWLYRKYKKNICPELNYSVMGILASLFQDVIMNY
jgi:hypothetical protein